MLFHRDAQLVVDQVRQDLSDVLHLVDNAFLYREVHVHILFFVFCFLSYVRIFLIHSNENALGPRDTNNHRDEVLRSIIRCKSSLKSA